MGLFNLCHCNLVCGQRRVVIWFCRHDAGMDFLQVQREARQWHVFAREHHVGGFALAAVGVRDLNGAEHHIAVIEVSVAGVTQVAIDGGQKPFVP